MDGQHGELNRRRREREQKRALHAIRMKRLKWCIIVAAVVLALCGVGLLIAFTVTGGESSAESTPTTTPAPTNPDTVIHFLAGGDLNVTKKVVGSGETAGGYDYSDVFQDVMPLLAAADLSAVNLEGNVYGTKYGTKYCAPAQLLEGLRNAGVDLVQMANSMTMANGPLGLESTLGAIRDNGMEPVGAFASEDEYEKSGGYFLREINGIKVAVVAFTKGGLGVPEDYEYCVNLLYKDFSTNYQKVDTAGINAVLKRIRAQKPDVTIALLHWGSEYNDLISATQEKICKLMLAGGVDAIVGTHPHYVQKVDFNAEDGTVVAYSLGDFLGDAEDKRTNYSILLDLEIRKDGETGKVKISAVNYVPLFLLDETATGGGMRILRMREAIAAYENNFINKVSQETYEAMTKAMGWLEARVKGE